MTEGKKGPGAPKGRRPVVWICNGIVGCTCGNAKLASEKFILKDKDPKAPDSVAFPQEDAEKQFADKFGVAAEIVYGPMYDKKGGQPNKAAKKKAAISRDFTGMKLSTKQCREAVYNGWNGLAFTIENQNDKVMFVFTSEVSPDPGKKRSTPGAARINISELQFIKTENEMISNI